MVWIALDAHTGHAADGPIPFAALTRARGHRVRDAESPYGTQIDELVSVRSRSADGEWRRESVVTSYRVVVPLADQGTPCIYYKTYWSEDFRTQYVHIRWSNDGEGWEATPPTFRVYPSIDDDHRYGGGSGSARRHDFASFAHGTVITAHPRDSSSPPT